MKNYLGAGLISIALFSFWILGMPAYSQRGQLKEVIAQRTEVLSERLAIIEKIRQLNTYYAEQSANIKKLSAIVPAAKSSAELVSSIDSLASQHGLQLIAFSANEERGELTAPYRSLSIDMTLTGSYLSLFGFLEGLERNVRIIDVNSIDAAPSTGEDTAILQFRIRASAYFLK